MSKWRKLRYYRGQDEVLHDPRGDARESQGGRSWRASGDRQISLNASAERAFANFRDKNTVFYNCKFLQHKRRFFALALTALR